MNKTEARAFGNHTLRAIALTLTLSLSLAGAALAGDLKKDGAVAIYAGLGPIKESHAYKQYIMRPNSDLSKLIYLIDRFGSIDGDILYDGVHYRTGWVANFARIFLTTSYHNETSKDWIMKWCNRSIMKGELIWAQFPNKKVQLSREVLLNELSALDALPAEISAVKVSQQTSSLQETTMASAMPQQSPQAGAKPAN
jgi:hypothetical protein